MKNLIKKLLMFIPSYRRSFNRLVAEECYVSGKSAACIIEVAQSLQEEGYIRTPEEFINFLNEAAK